MEPDDIGRIDLASDPNEDNNRAESDPEVLAKLQSDLEVFEGALPLPELDGEIGPVARKDLSDAECEQLAALGYVDPGCNK